MFTSSIEVEVIPIKTVNHLQTIMFGILAHGKPMHVTILAATVQKPCDNFSSVTNLYL